MSDRENIIEKVRALLAKAESTTYEAEADAFYAKAQDLMLQYAVDEAELQAAGHKKRTEEIVMRPVTIKKGPASQPRVQFLMAVAKAFNCQMFVYTKTDQAVVVGYESDTMFVELLYLSVNIQCFGAMGREVSAARRREKHPKSYGYCDIHDTYGCDGKFKESAYRRGFAAGYFGRVAQRVTDRYAKKMEDVEESTAIVLRDKGKEVEDWLNNRMELQPSKSRRHDYSWSAYGRGRVEGEGANIGVGQDAVGSSPELPA